MNSADDYTANTFILAWDMYGLESCVNATQVDREKVWNTLANKEDSKESIASILHFITMRARLNSHRHYEVYAIDVDESIDEDSIRASFENDPQSMAELIRSRGRKIHSDCINKDGRVKIT